MIHYVNEPVDFRLPTFLVVVIKLWLEQMFGRECAKCGDNARLRHVDHVIPTPHDYRPENLQLLCDICHKEVRFLPHPLFDCSAICSRTHHSSKTEILPRKNPHAQC